ncbi:hypothetical protein [Streptomyces sp. DH24]|uniref:hypothetical protein n=1 Tax=Streptomyces sp. DH24 TaxID=3040123 RepID=UPI002442B011|nr:hypothetical protein [Streptomyces sp. DH24]MDG9716790.1 hypothetical protein [Streptomyces sp. DH24]
MKSSVRLVWCGVIAALGLATGCSSEQQPLSEKYPTQWKTCDALFGAKNMDALRDILGPDDLEFTNRPLSVEKIRKGLTEEALEPYDEIEGFDEYDVCWLSGGSQFRSDVAWAAASLKEVQSSSGRWKRVGPDLYVANSAGTIDLVFRCEVRGASNGQQAQVLLEARVSDVGSPEFSQTFHEELAVRLARAVRDEVACTNEPVIPDDLAIRE